ncbi:hypothetical protein BH10PSE14_BH10PSE14_25750 [soil metagenome]
MPGRIGRPFVLERRLVLTATTLLMSRALTLAAQTPAAQPPAAPTAAAQSTAAQSPESFLQSIYEPYLKDDFKGQPYWQVDRYFMPELGRAIEADMREAKRRGEVPALDGDPFVDAQEWDVENLAIKVETDGQKATGLVNFDNLGKAKQVILDLLRTGIGWRIVDIKAPSGVLSDLYKKK